MQKIYLERIFSLVLMALSLSVYSQSEATIKLKFGLMTGSAFFPQWLAIILFISSFIPFFKSFLRPKKETKNNISLSYQAMIKIIYFLIVIGLTLLTIPYIGWYPCQIIMVGILEMTLEKRSFSKACIISIVAAVVIYLIFETGLNIPLPVGSIFE